jgi:hypothetical protein
LPKLGPLRPEIKPHYFYKAGLAYYHLHSYNPLHIFFLVSEYHTLTGAQQQLTPNNSQEAEVRKRREEDSGKGKSTKPTYRKTLRKKCRWT